IPVNFPLSSGITLPTALAAPVEDGMMFCPAPRPPLQSLAEGPSTVFCVAVVACTVVIRPSSIPQLSLTTFAKGARQLVVQEALETKTISGVNLDSFTPITNIGVSSLEGADITTLLAPASICPWAVSLVKNNPVDSTMISAPTSSHLRLAGLFSAVTRISCPLTTNLPSLTSTSPLNCPWVESYLSI